MQHTAMFSMVNANLCRCKELMNYNHSIANQGRGEHGLQPAVERYMYAIVFDLYMIYITCVSNLIASTFTPSYLMSSLPHTCLGCDAPFGMQKQLSAHLSQCSCYHELTDQIFERKHKSWKRCTKDEKRSHQVATVSQKCPTTFDQAPNVFEEGVVDDHDCLVLPFGDMDDEHQGAMSGPPSPPPPVISQRSGRLIRMPAHFTDFLPGSSTHLAHMPLSAHQQQGCLQ
ncbi:hypothetical protein EDC04DRAFT_2914368 [Pisolithus marmoratus]|nr:hypothetical protein EDC04DRAFT_2914368 [Pisolithus marmoratus]